MSISTRAGDNGTTSLRYNRRVSKSHVRVQAYGNVDDLNALLGAARCHAKRTEPDEASLIHGFQETLIHIGAELALDDADRVAHPEALRGAIGEETVQGLDRLVSEWEGEGIRFEGFVLPGETDYSAALHIARTACRRAEVAAVRVREAGGFMSDAILRYLNRLSDVLWLMAYRDEKKAGGRD